MEQFKEEHHKKTKLLIEEYKNTIVVQQTGPYSLFLFYKNAPIYNYRKNVWNIRVTQNYWYTDPQVLKEQYKSELSEYFNKEIQKYLVKDLLNECFSFVI